MKHRLTTPLRFAGRRSLGAALLGLFVVPAVGTLVGCEDYDSPPRTQIVGLTDGLLPSVSAPITIAFTEPIDPETLSVKIARFETDDEGNLYDEDASDATKLEIFYDYKKQVDYQGGRGTLNAARDRFTIALDTTLPIGPRLVLIVEKGLADDAGRETQTRGRIEFGYEFNCEGSAVPDFFASGTYFFVVDVQEPIETQIQLLAWLDIDRDTGTVLGQFSNADRNPDPNRCSPACASDEACRTIPNQECVIPSDKAGSADEYPDFFANDNDTETAYTFTVQACVQLQDDGSVGFGNAPVDVKVPVPAVTVKGIDLSSAFSVAADGVLRGSGSFSAEKVLLGIIDSGPGSGTLTARFVNPEDEPGEIPKPPPDAKPQPTSGGGGAGGAN